MSDYITTTALEDDIAPEADAPPVNVDDAPPAIKKAASPARAIVAPLIGGAVFIGVWALLCRLQVLNDKIVPSPAAVAKALAFEITSGRLWNDLVASLFRVAIGFCASVVIAMPLGLWLGRYAVARSIALPAVNFFRSLSPLAWVPFAIAWFGIGDAPAIFLIVMATLFPLTLATLAAVASIPRNYFRVAEDYDVRGVRLLTAVTLPAVMPQIITALRVTAGIAWLVVVAAEMIAGRDGLGFAIWDARNGLRPDMLVAEMLVIGIIGVMLDWLLVRLTQIPSVRWGYEC